MVLAEMLTYMQSSGLGTIGTNLFEGSLPDEPDASVALYERESYRAPIRAMGGTAFEQPSVQVVVRDADYTTGRNKAQQVFDLWDDYDGTLTAVKYLDVVAEGSVFHLGRDDRRRHLFAVNLWVRKKVSPTV